MKLLRDQIWQYISVISGIISIIISLGKPELALFFGIIVAILTFIIILTSWMNGLDYDTGRKVRLVIMFMSLFGLFFLYTAKDKPRIVSSYKPDIVGATMPTPFATPAFTKQEWNQDVFILRLESSNFYTDTAVIGWSLLNKTNEDLSIPLSYYEGFYAKDNLGNVIEIRTYACDNRISKDLNCENVGIRIAPKGEILFFQQLDFKRNDSSATAINITALNIPKTFESTFVVPVER